MFAASRDAWVWAAGMPWACGMLDEAADAYVGRADPSSAPGGATPPGGCSEIGCGWMGACGNRGGKEGFGGGRACCIGGGWGGGG